MSPSDPQADKRRNLRLSAPKVVVRIPSVDRFRTHYLKDISEGGLFVKAEKVLPVGALLSLELWPPGWDEAVELSAKVIRSTDAQAAAKEGVPCGMAVQFVSIPVEVDRQLKSLVEAYHGATVEAPADPVGAQIEAMIQELATARERLALLETQLAEARGQAEAFAEQIHTLEREETEARSNSALLAQERTDLERKLKEAAGKAATEQAKLKEQLDVARAAGEESSRKLEHERDESRKQREAAAKVAVAEQAKLKEQLEVGRLANEDLVRKLELEKAEARKQRETAAKTANAEQIKTREQLDAARTAREELNRELTQLREELRQQQDRGDRTTLELEKRDAREQELKRLLSRVASPKADVAFNASDGDDVIVVSDSGEKTGEFPMPDDDDSDLDIEVGDLGLEDEIEAGFSAMETPGPILTNEIRAAAPGADPDGFAEFSAFLKPKTRILAGGNLGDRVPAGEDESRILELLGASPTFETLLSQLEGKVPVDWLRRFLFTLSSEQRIDLRD